MILVCEISRLRTYSLNGTTCLVYLSTASESASSGRMKRDVLSQCRTDCSSLDMAAAAAAGGVLKAERIRRIADDDGRRLRSVVITSKS